ncbi:hypothetical protein PB2503_11324 [Parvularcula bermudensis HTCC2503]|uniref:Acetyltransferase n=1 Tax=Parvularcula bermudensis (strain ATCC BAA-594 / HTCC2503 / KCTC 12087) TaxID=314260 RepID=E0TC54_PARBH|nr:putative colanic acid biosynthesis acetyltransferase [Parvularcula bermudensis]ADM10312.1 hypothetical protein PB2503_11324 [Parvularcula bermudensis HTCC2503]
MGVEPLKREREEVPVTPTTVRPTLTPPPSIGNKLRRLAFQLAWAVFARWTPAPLHAWRCRILRLFGAQIAGGAAVYPDVTIWAPWNLQLAAGACLGPGVDCYNVAQVSIGRDTTVSQRTYICTASHDHRDPAFPLVTAPVQIGAKGWLAAEAFVGPGVEIGEGVVAAARSVIVRSVPAWTVVAGNPAHSVATRPPF